MWSYSKKKTVVEILALRCAYSSVLFVYLHEHCSSIGLRHGFKSGLYVHLHSGMTPEWFIVAIKKNNTTLKFVGRSCTLLVDESELLLVSLLDLKAASRCQIHLQIEHIDFLCFQTFAKWSGPTSIKLPVPMPFVWQFFLRFFMYACLAYN